MSAVEVQVSAVRRACAMGLVVAVLVIGTMLAVLSGAPAEAVNMPTPGILLLLVAVYLAAAHFTLDYEFRQQSHSMTLVQLPLALGVQLVAPLVHVTARVVAIGVVAVTTRQAPLKAIYNLATACLEVGAASFAVSLAPQDAGPYHWLALYVGLLVGDLVGGLLLGAVWRLIGVPVEMRSVLASLVAVAPVTLTFTGLAIVAVVGIDADVALAPILLGLTGGLLLAHRAHRRTVLQQRATERLYAFVKDLGPLDLGGPDTAAAVDRVRLLLHAQQLDLSVRQGDRWSHLVTAEGQPVRRESSGVRPLSSQVAATGTAALRRGAKGDADSMATPLVGSSGLVGILTATDRMGATRSFDMQDLRLHGQNRRHLQPLSARGA